MNPRTHLVSAACLLILGVSLAAAQSQHGALGGDGPDPGRLPKNWSLGTGGDIMYTLSSPTSPRLHRVDQSNGQVLETFSVTGHEAIFGGLAADDAADLYSIDGYNDGNPDRTFRINRLNGQGVVVGPTGFNWNFRWVYTHPVSDVLYSGTDNRVCTTDKTTGLVTFVANISGPTLDQMTAVAIDSQGNAYGTDIGEVGLFKVDIQTGAATHLGDLRPGTRTWFDDLAFDSNDVLWGVARDGVYTIDLEAVTITQRFAGTYVGLVFVNLAPPCDPCDANCDGEVNAFDIEPFIKDVFEGDPQCSPCASDVNGDGELNAFDIEPFIDCLFGP